jgi:hypothetical protein
MLIGVLLPNKRERLLAIDSAMEVDCRLRFPQRKLHCQKSGVVIFYVQKHTVRHAFPSLRR